MKRLLVFVFALFLLMFITTIFTCVQGQVRDIDGNLYKTVKIGNQTWFAEDLKVARFNNGDIIPDLTNDWQSMSKKPMKDQTLTKSYPALSYYENDRSFPPLYNGYVVIDNRNVCPKGYRVPSQNDINILIQFLGDLNSAAQKLKSKDSWNKEGNNLTGFNLEGRGICYGLGGFGQKYEKTCLLINSIEKGIHPFDGSLMYNLISLEINGSKENQNARINSIGMPVGGTIRCIKDY